MNTFITVFIASFKTFLRDRLMLFFAIMFPLVFALMFGFIFGGQTYDASTIRIGILKDNTELQEVVTKDKRFTVIEYENKDILYSEVDKGKLNAGIIFADDILELLLNRNALMRMPALRNNLTDLAVKLGKKPEVREMGIKVEAIPIVGGKIQSEYLSYLIPGVIAISLLTRMFTALEIFLGYKKRGIIKTITTTAANPSSFVLGSISGRILTSTLISILLLLLLIVIFRLHYEINWPLFLITTFLGSLMMFSFGTLISLFFTNYEAANGFANILMTLMFFLSGVYFPLEFLPRTFRTIGMVLPAYHLAITLRMALGVDKLIINYIYSVFGFIILATIVTFFIAQRRVFRIE